MRAKEIVSEPATGVPWHPRWDWMLGDRLIIWILLIALPAIVIYAIGRCSASGATVVARALQSCGEYP